MYILRYAVTAVLALFSLGAYAYDTDATGNFSEMSTIDCGNGLVARVPATAPSELMNQVRTLRSELLVRQTELNEKVAEDESNTTRDVIITVVMPGGLAYGAYRTLQYQKSQEELETITGDLDQLSKDLQMLESVKGSDRVSMLHGL